MHFAEQIFHAMQGWFWPKPAGNITLGASTLDMLQSIAKQEQRTPEEVAERFLKEGLREIEAQDENRRRWHSLSAREKEVAALICLDYSRPKIGMKLGISVRTVNTHVEHIFEKFDVPNREALRKMLHGWDFFEWDQDPPEQKGDGKR